MLQYTRIDYHMAENIRRVGDHVYWLLKTNNQEIKIENNGKVLGGQDELYLNIYRFLTFEPDTICNINDVKFYACLCFYNYS